MKPERVNSALEPRLMVELPLASAVEPAKCSVAFIAATYLIGIPLWYKSDSLACFCVPILLHPSTFLSPFPLQDYSTN